jgi:hypothetical protein
MKRLAAPIALASALVGIAAVAAVGPRGGRRIVGGDADGASRVEIRHARGDLLVRAADVRRVSASADVRGDTEVAFDRTGDALRVALDPPREGTCLTVVVPRSTHLVVRADHSRVGVRGADGVEVRIAKGALELRDVAGAIRVESTKAYVAVELAPERPTTSIELDCAKSDVCLEIPSTLRASYEVDATKSETAVPASASDGIPVRLRVTKSRLAIVEGAASA